MIPPSRVNVMRAILVFLATLVASSLLPSAALARPSPACPWCTTPTKCEAIKESTPIAGCYILQGEGTCEEVQGECEYQQTFAHTKEVLGTTTADLLEVEDPKWGKVLAFPIEGALYGWWNCEGKLVAIYLKESKGVVERLRVEAYSEVYSFRNVTAAIN